MTSDSEDSGPEPRARPNGTAWRDAQQRVSDRNDQARKSGRAQRAEYERQQAARRRAEEKRGGVYR
jgi:hypothetical protein